MHNLSFVRDVQAQQLYAVTGATLLAIGLLCAALPVAAQSPACMEIQIGVHSPIPLDPHRTALIVVDRRGASEQVADGAHDEAPSGEC